MDQMITIQKFKNDIESSQFLKVYSKLLSDNKSKEINEDEIFTIFKLSLVLINYGDAIVSKFGYRLILRYCNLFEDYRPLYDYTLSKDYAPISKYIQENFKETVENDGIFNSTFINSYLENFKYKDVYLSKGQKEIVNFSEKTDGDFTVIAPTSYGKSEIMIEMIKKFKKKKILIIVPTKALIAQTRKRILAEIKNLHQYGNIIVHPDMYNKNEKFIAVLTQERFFRLLQKENNLAPDLILVDEAHALLENTNRARLLAYVLIISKKRNINLNIRYFTPFLIDSESINIPYIKSTLKNIKTSESLKVERFYYIYNKFNNGEMYLYDQFLNTFYKMNKFNNANDIEIISRIAGKKNIIYLNKTKDLESAAKMLSNELDLLKDKSIQKVCKSVEDFLHKDYNLIKCLKRGVVYHHGTMPDLIRLYVEDAFRNITGIKFIVTSSTLLEGVNIPADKLFILDNKKGKSNLTQSQFKNLIGRVCRFSEIFNKDKGNLRLLEPRIYIFKGMYTGGKSNIKDFIKNNAREDKLTKDIKKNIMLKNEFEVKNMSKEEKEELNKAIEYIENIEPNIIKKSNINHCKFEIGKLCYLNNVTEFDIIDNEEILNKNFIYVGKQKISTTNDLISTIVKVFLNDEINIKSNQENIKRLRDIKTQKFYSMLLEWRSKGSSYKYMINSFLYHWNTVSDKIVYVGKWGDIKRNEEDRKELFIDVTKKTKTELVNLAIVRIEEEQDFLENVIMKFIEIFHDLEIIDSKFYERIKYGSNDPYIIYMLKNGYSIELSKCLMLEEFNEYVDINLEEDRIAIDSDIFNLMKTLDINEILIFELKYHVNLKNNL